MAAAGGSHSGVFEGEFAFPVQMTSSSKPVITTRFKEKLNTKQFLFRERKFEKQSIYTIHKSGKLKRQFGTKVHTNHVKIHEYGRQQSNSSIHQARNNNEVERTKIRIIRIVSSTYLNRSNLKHV